MALAKSHDRTAFDCDDPDFNEYLQRYARQNDASGSSKCFIAISPTAPTRVLGYYTLSPACLAYSRVPESAKKGLAHYDVPVFRLGKLATDKTIQRKGLGGELIIRAGERCMRVAQEVGGVALLIDAKDDRAAQWYGGFGANPLLDAPLSLVLPFATVADAVRRRNEKGETEAGES